MVAYTPRAFRFRGKKGGFSVIRGKELKESAVDFVDRLVGSLPLPPEYRGKDLDTLIKDAKHAYLKKRAFNLCGRQDL
ncbi:MAG: hypothetical protein Q7R79_04680 [bacterium]|nr:hypothetical protein [bacterium]